MAKNTYAIMGATGHIGLALTEKLLKNGHKVRAIGRDKNKLQMSKEKGAEIINSSFDDVSALTEAFKGCNAIFSFIPPGYNADDLGAFQDKIGEAIKQALMKSKVQHILNLSSIGANLSDGTGPIKGLHRHEKRLNSLPNINILHLRPAYFMENFLWDIPSIKNTGILGSPINSDLPIPMIATRDIGLKAADLLIFLHFTGHTVVELVGPREVTMKTAAAVLGKAIGKSDLKYLQLPYSEAEKKMLTAGMKPDLVKQMIEMYKAFNEGNIELTQQMKPDQRGKTTLEDFSKIFAQAYQSSPQLATAHH